jgi:uncharacterized repeat protein (TIGR03803 family)
MNRRAFGLLEMGGQRRKVPPSWSIALSLSIAAVTPGQPHAQTLTALYSFCAEVNCTDGDSPANLIADAYGNLFGTADGGRYGYGTVFEIGKTAGGYASTPATLVDFSEWSGATTGLSVNASGNVFGALYAGGAYAAGSVFRISKTKSGAYVHTPVTLVSFNDTNGPYGPMGLMMDRSNALLSMAVVAPSGYNAIIKIPRTQGGGAALPTTLVNFTAADGASQEGGLVADAQGDLFGTSEEGGAYGYGSVFELARAKGGFAGNLAILASFANFSAGVFPAPGLAIDADGDLFGLTYAGGAYGDGGFGTVFEIAKTEDGYAGTPTTLASFDDANGETPVGGLIIDADGNLFGTTELGGPYAANGGYGTVFELAKTQSGYANTPTTLATFNGTNGASPLAGLIADGDGNLFGTTFRGGTYGGGTVFEVTGAGFVVFTGMAGTADCISTSVSALARQHSGLVAAAAALGYSGVQDLQQSIVGYCGG